MSDALWVDVHAKYALLLPELGGLNNLLPRCSDVALRDGGEGVGSAGCCAGAEAWWPRHLDVGQPLLPPHLPRARRRHGAVLLLPVSLKVLMCHYQITCHLLRGATISSVATPAPTVLAHDVIYLFTRLVCRCRMDSTSHSPSRARRLERSPRCCPTTPSRLSLLASAAPCVATLGWLPSGHPVGKYPRPTGRRGCGPPARPRRRRL